MRSYGVSQQLYTDFTQSAESQKFQRETEHLPPPDPCVYVFTYCSNRPFSSSSSRFSAILSGSARSEPGSQIHLLPRLILIPLISTWMKNKQGMSII